MRFAWVAAAAFILASPTPTLADPMTNVALRFTCDSRTSRAVIAVGLLDVIEHVVDTKGLHTVMDLDSLPRNEEARLCRLGSTTISIVPLISGEHPRRDNAYVLVNGVQVERTFWNEGEYGVVTAAPNPNGPAGLTVKVCRMHNDRPASLYGHAPCAPLDRP